MIQHIALTINDSAEIKNFYENILLFSLKHKSTVNGEITRQVFNNGETVDVFMMEHLGIQLEIFLSPKKERKIFSHICLAYKKAEIIYSKTVKLGYKALVKKNPVSDTYFIWDKSGNMFEIKEIIK